MNDQGERVVPAVSVVIPAYNAAATLGRALQSVLAQDCGEPLEIIVVDDGSTDDTAEVVRRDFPQVRLIVQDHTGVPATARNRGVQEARAHLIAFLDADDEWLPHKLSRQLAFLRHHAEVSFVTCRSRAVYSDGRRRDPPALKDRSEAVRLDLVAWLQRRLGDSAVAPCPSGWLIRRSLYQRLGGMDDSWPTSADWKFITQSLAAGETVAALIEPLFNYHVSPRSVSRDPYRLDRLDVARKMLAFVASLRPVEADTPLTPEQHAQAMFAQARRRARWLHRTGYLQGALEMARLALAQPTGKPPPLGLRLEAAALVVLRALLGPVNPLYGRLFRTLRRLTTAGP